MRLKSWVVWCWGMGIGVLGVHAALPEPQMVRVDFGGETALYPLVRPHPQSPVSMVYINYRDDPKAIEATRKSLGPLVPEATEVIVIVGDKANILGALIAKDLGLPWVILTSKRPPTSARGIKYRSITSGEKKLYLSLDQKKFLRGKKVVVLDDVLSSGETMCAAVSLLETVSDLTLLGICVGFTEGEKRESLTVGNKTYPVKMVGHLPLVH